MGKRPSRNFEVFIDDYDALDQKEKLFIKTFLQH